ncbi:MAG: hypothetical protein LWW98_01435 [Deltaproteobacteria bacterium]|nr:hypothetical protein [Deltaproteobacteria bacterium]
MKRSLIYIVPIIFSIVFCSQVKAAISGNCVNCHTIHNSQDGSDMATYGGTSGENPCLTRGGCVGCHAYGAGSGTYNVENIGGSEVPQVWHTGTDLAAGNFKYLADADNRGHNVFAINQEGDEGGGSMFPLPGCEDITATNFSCAGKYGCHGDRNVTDETVAMKGAHHADDSTIDGRTTGTSYRFLKGVLGLENNGDNPWQNKNPIDHNEYQGLIAPPNDASATSPGTGGSISGFCAECHDYHDDWTESGHPTDHSLPNDDEYTSYTTYSIIAPVARVILPETPSGTVAPTGTNDDIVMCLSCHGAHATNHYKLMRWDNLNNWSGCSVCHKSKQ